MDRDVIGQTPAGLKHPGSELDSVHAELFTPPTSRSIAGTGDQAGSIVGASTKFDESLSWIKKQTFSLDVNGISYHLNRGEKDRRDFNERNYGLGVEMTTSENTSVMLGQYRNSINRETHYAMLSYTPLKVGPVKFGAMAGALDGYYFNNGGFIPAVAPEAVIDRKHIGLRAMFIPPMKGVAAVVGLQLKVNF